MVDTSAVLESDRELLKEMDAKVQLLRSMVDGLNKTEKDVLKLTKQLKEVQRRSCCEPRSDRIAALSAGKVVQPKEPF